MTLDGSMRILEFQCNYYAVKNNLGKRFEF